MQGRASERERERNWIRFNKSAETYGEVEMMHKHTHTREKKKKLK
jgi:hypothetical protein